MGRDRDEEYADPARYRYPQQRRPWHDPDPPLIAQISALLWVWFDGETLILGVCRPRRIGRPIAGQRQEYEAW